MVQQALIGLFNEWCPACNIASFIWDITTHSIYNTCTSFVLICVLFTKSAKPPQPAISFMWVQAWFIKILFKKMGICSNLLINLVCAVTYMQCRDTSYSHFVIIFNCMGMGWHLVSFWNLPMFVCPYTPTRINTASTHKIKAKQIF